MQSFVPYFIAYSYHSTYISSTILCMFLSRSAVFLMFLSEMEQSTCFIRPLYFTIMSVSLLNYRKSRYEILYFSISTLPSSAFWVLISLTTLAVWQRVSLFEPLLLRCFSLYKTSSWNFFSSYSNFVPFSIIFFKKILFLSLLSIFSANSLFFTGTPAPFLLFFSYRYFFIISLCSFHSFFSPSSTLASSVELYWMSSFFSLAQLVQNHWGTLMVLNFLKGNLILLADEQSFPVDLLQLLQMEFSFVRYSQGCEWFKFYIDLSFSPSALYNIFSISRNYIIPFSSQPKPLKALYPLLCPFCYCYNIRFMSDNQRIDQHVLNRYKVLKKIGSGAYGHVWKVTAGERGNDVFALKKVFQAFQHATDAQRTFREISILKKIQHPNIVRLFEVMPSVSERDIYLLFEFVNTDVYHAIYEGALEEIHKKYIVYQLLLGLYYLHSAHLLHRDLKPSNLLLNQQCQLKICDFGLVRHLDEVEEESAVLTEGVATKWYRAPQILLGSQKYNQKVDIWSVGCILAEMVIKNPLFNCNSTIAHIEKIIQVTGRPTFEEIEEIGGSTESILKQCSSKQKSPKQLFGANIDEKCLDLLVNLLRFSSSRRFSALQALKHPYFKQFFKESDLRPFKGSIKLQTDDNVKLSTEAYKQLILKHFIEKREPQRFSDLRRGEKSFGKVLTQMNSRKASGQKDRCQQRKNVHLFQQILREKQNSLKHNSRNKSNTRDKENLMCNKENREGRQNLDKFSTLKPSKPGTFAALRKANAPKFSK